MSWPARAGPFFAALLIRALRRTVRLRVHGRETVERFAAEGQRYIHVFWHAHLLLMVYSYVGPRLVFMISRSRDGELIARAVEGFGPYTIARGSTTVGGAAALRELIRAYRADSDIGLTPDGPRGPARKVQPGCIAAAKHLGIPIVPIAMGASHAWYFNSWDRFVFPKPLSRVLFAYGAPFRVADGEGVPEAALRLEREMLALEEFAQAHAADPGVGTRP